jgi:hypothetical protein
MSSSVIEQFAVLRGVLVAIGDSIPEEKMFVIPAGFGNHALWNLGHLAITEQLLVYGLSGLPKQFEDVVIGDFRKGSSPKTWTRSYSWEEVRGWLLEQPETLKEDYAAGKFQTYTEYKTSTGLILRNVHDALSYNLYHEGVHLGYLLALRKLL